jgi:predicted MPP superfamily phosphohydrolase
MTNLEALISRISFEIVNEGILDENEINKLLGILANDGVYAMWVYAKSQKDIKEEDLFGKLKEILKIVSELTNDNYESYFQKVSEDLTKLLFLKQLLEKTLIYARYHARASGE